MSKKYSEELTKEQIKELEDIMGELTDTAKEVVEDYAKNPSELSGSAVQIHEESPYLDSDKNDDPLFKEDKWKRILNPGLPFPPQESKKKKKKKK